MATAHIVGSINRDIVAFVDRHPAPGETILGKRWAAFPGGKGANQAVAVARLGGSVRMIGCVGDDSFGADMRAFLAAEGVDTSRIATAPAVATGIALITVDAWAQNSITVISGANASWPRAPQLDIAPGDAVVCQLEVPLPIIIDAFRRARSSSGSG
jgi:ribokinase